MTCAELAALRARIADDATPPCGGTMTLTRESDRSDGDLWRVECTDHGELGALATPYLLRHHRDASQEVRDYAAVAWQSHQAVHLRHACRRLFELLEKAEEAEADALKRVADMTNHAGAED